MGQKAWFLFNRMEGSFYLKPNEGRFQTDWNLCVPSCSQLKTSLLQKC